MVASVASVTSVTSAATMSDSGSSVTLIFYAIDRNNITSEPLLNIAAAIAQWSSFTHVEVALGESAGVNGQMRNVLRVFNDATGVVSSVQHQRARAI